VVVGAIVIGRLLLTRGEEPAALTTPSATATISPTATATVMATPAQTSDPSVAQYLKPLVSSWRPTDTTLIVARVTQPPLNRPMEFTLVAVPAAGGSATPLIGLPAEPKNWDMRRDGSALVVSVDVGQDRSRLATWDLRTGLLRWITADEASTRQGRPRWSPDGTHVYFGRYTDRDLGLFRVGSDGSGLQRIRAPLPPGQPPLNSIPQLVTEQGVLLWGRAYEGMTLEALDLATGRERSFGDCAELESWRPTQPRALVETGRCGIAQPGFGLALWDDSTGSRRTLADVANELTLGADWDTTGSRIVAALRPRTGSQPYALVTMDDRGGARTSLQGSEHARSPLWVRAGIAYLWAMQVGDWQGPLDFRPPHEIRLVAPSGGTPRTLYRSDDQLVEIRFVRP
jgi:hypothetical protein